ncbi:MAG: hypothetical protein ACJ0OS_00970 [Candidatus Marisimplicoccus sp.]
MIESKSIGADSILLIASILSPKGNSGIFLVLQKVLA